MAAEELLKVGDQERAVSETDMLTPAEQRLKDRHAHGCT